MSELPESFFGGPEPDSDHVPVSAQVVDQLRKEGARDGEWWGVDPADVHYGMTWDDLAGTYRSTGAFLQAAALAGRVHGDVTNGVMAVLRARHLVTRELVVDFVQAEVPGYGVQEAEDEVVAYQALVLGLEQYIADFEHVAAETYYTAAACEENDEYRATMCDLARRAVEREKRARFRTQELEEDRKQLLIDVSRLGAAY